MSDLRSVVNPDGYLVDQLSPADQGYAQALPTVPPIGMRLPRLVAGDWIDENPLRLEEAISQVSGDIKDVADGLRSQILADSTEFERSAWPAKASEAERYQQTANPDDAPLLVAEAQAGEVPLDVLVAVVAGKAATFYQLEAQISGNKGKHLRAVSTLSAVDDVLAYDYSDGWPQLG